MDAERFARLERLFHQALERGPAERTTRLAAACRGDRDLFREVTSLLAAHARPAAILTQPARWSSPPDPESGVSWLGRQIGPYRLLELLGEGGSSAVYRAERTDGAYQGVVAIKLLAQLAWTPAGLRRFHRECQILARLQHPGIARLRDAGTTSEGVPYLVMDYVEGEPIDRFCLRRRLTIDQRLRLLLKVCSAVGHAHRNLVIHRDIKPANVLVTPRGQPRLLDFGIATLLDPSPTAGDAETTRTGWRPMTVRYASPEQLRGEPLTTASDVYSLGVLLYQLLCGRLPVFTGRRGPLSPEPRETLLEPLKPSVACASGSDPDSVAPSDSEEIARQRRAQSRRLRRKLTGDLDNVALKALAENPDRRYRTVEQLAGDLRRYLEGRPVSARRTGFPKRLAKLAARYKLAASLVSFLLLAVLGYAATTTWLLGEIVRQRDEAEYERHRATRVTRSLMDLLAPADPAAGDATAFAAVALDLGAERIAGELPGEGEVRVRASPSGLAQLPDLRGEAAQAEEPFEEVLSIARQALPPRSPQLAHLLVPYGELLTRQGAPARGEILLREAYALRRRALPLGDPLRARAAGALGASVAAQGRYEEAEALLLEEWESVAGGEAAPGPRRRAAERLAALYQAWGREEGAEPYRVLLEGRAREEAGTEVPGGPSRRPGS